MSLLAVLVAQLLALVAGQVDVRTMDSDFLITDLYGQRRLAEAAFDCAEEGRPTLWLSKTAPEETHAHELAHAVDCLDDGMLNGSPSRRPSERPPWASDYCWDSDAEWYACAVVKHGRMDPHLAAGWAPVTRSLPAVATATPSPAALASTPTALTPLALAQATSAPEIEAQTQPVAALFGRTPNLRVPVITGGRAPIDANFSLFVFSGGTSEELVTASICPRVSVAFWVTDRDGTFHAFVPEATVSLVNAGWHALFAGGIPANTALVGRCA